jgi:PAS domain S-box-containing protein
MKVLVAEDDDSTRLLISSLLNVWGYEAITVKDGKEAWERMKVSDPPKLLIMDWMMPGIHGIELCRLTRETPAAIKPYIIFLTCRSQTEDIVTALQGGADDYITKPFDTEELRARLQAGMRILELQADLKRERDRAQLYLDKAGVLLMVLNEAGQITLINPKGGEILGYSPADLIGQNWFIKFLNPEDRKAARHIFKQIISFAINCHHPVVQTVVIRTGEERLLEIYFSILDNKNGDSIEVLFSGTDITEKEKAGAALRKSEESYRGLFDSFVSSNTVLSTYKNIRTRG